MRNGRLNDAQRMSMVRAGRWRRQTIPRNARILALGGVFPFLTAMEIANKWLRALGDHEKMISFRNLVLGLTHRETGEAPDSEKLYGRRESHSLGTVQPGVLFPRPVPTSRRTASRFRSTDGAGIGNAGSSITSFCLAGPARSRSGAS